MAGNDLREAGPGLIREWIERAARHDPDKPYIVSVEDGRTLSYGALYDLTRRMATLLGDRGIATNDRIALLAGNAIEHVVCYLGVMAYGATICTVHVEMNRRHLGGILGSTQPPPGYCGRRHRVRRDRGGDTGCASWPLG